MRKTVVALLVTAACGGQTESLPNASDTKDAGTAHVRPSSEPAPPPASPRAPESSSRCRTDSECPSGTTCNYSDGLEPGGACGYRPPGQLGESCGWGRPCAEGLVCRSNGNDYSAICGRQVKVEPTVASVAWTNDGLGVNYLAPAHDLISSVSYALDDRVITLTIHASSWEPIGEDGPHHATVAGLVVQPNVVYTVRVFSEASGKLLYETTVTSP